MAIPNNITKITSASSQTKYENQLQPYVFFNRAVERTTVSPSIYYSPTQSTFRYRRNIVAPPRTGK